MKITEATITLKGDPSVGIPETQFRVVDMDMDLDTMDGDHAKIVKDLRNALVYVAAILSDMRSTVFLHGWDDRNAPPER